MGDIDSTITFNSGYSPQGMLVPIGSVNIHLAYHGGGTNFDQALLGAAEALRNNPSDCIPFLLFMSDGHGGGNPMQATQSFRSRYRGFKCDTIGLGDGVDVATMTCHCGIVLQLLWHCPPASMAEAGGGSYPASAMAEAGGGSYHASDISNISSIFGEIAADCAAIDGMVQKFGEEIAKMVSTRIVLEHL